MRSSASLPCAIICLRPAFTSASSGTLMDPLTDTTAAPVESEIEFDIAHVLCTDIVGYSKLLIDQQSDQLAKLNRLVRETEAFRRAAQSGKLLCIPTGDG